MDQAITLFFNGSHSLYLDAFAWSATHIQVWIPFLLVIVYVLFKEHDFAHFFFIIGAATYGAMTANKKIILTQGGPAILALLSILLLG